MKEGRVTVSLLPFFSPTYFWMFDHLRAVLLSAFAQNQHHPDLDIIVIEENC